ncbi:MAG: thioredoxin domain-containing protein [Pseudomonadota bacterium]
MDAVFNVTPDNFQSEVVEKSTTMPVVLLFWAEQVPPSVAQKQLAETVLAQYQGKVLLGLCDVAQDQSLAQHLQVRGLPALRVVHQGKIVEQLDGPADEDSLRNLLDALTQSPADVIKAQLEQIIAAGEFDTAVELLQQAINEEPANQAFRIELEMYLCARVTWRTRGLCLRRFQKRQKNESARKIGWNLWKRLRAWKPWMPCPRY